MRRLLAIGVAAATALTAATVAVAAPDTTGAPGIGDRYFPQYGNGGYDVAHYNVTTAYSTWSGRLQGKTTIKARATQDLSTFNLDFVLTVDSVRVDGEPARFTRPNRHELRVRPRTPVTDGSVFTVTVTYHGRPEQKVVGGLAPWISGPGEALALGEPEIAAWWFPSNDHPRDKATFDISIRVPRGQQAISNGVLASRDRGPRYTRWSWRMTDPMATYLAFFAAGRFRLESGSVAGLPHVYAVSRGLRPGEQDKSLKLLRRTQRIVGWLSDHYGEYPFSATGGVVTSLFTGFALENQSRPVYPYVGAGATGLLVHELSHQWFGDTVSVDRWRDIWLNEGFASFAEWMWDEEVHGRSAADRLENVYQSWPASDRFWRVRIGNPGRDKLFDWAVYQRGAMTLQALRNRIGNDDLATALRTWVTDHADGTARVGQFEQLAEDVSGEDLTGFFDAWLRSPTRPAHTAENGLG